MSYLKNKMKRIKTKYSNILMRDFGIRMSESATEILVICNGGLCNGITREMVCNTFEAYGDLEDVIMVPRKSYCFVKFRDSSNANDAFNKINGEKVWPEVKGPIYLGFALDINSSLLVSSSNFTKPPGLVLIEDFITEEEEKFILELMGLDSEEDNGTELKHRKVKHYGYEFKYLLNNVDLNESIQEIPKQLDFLWKRLHKYESGINFIPDQLTVNRYEPGQGIPPHVDTHSAFEDGILSLSLESTVVMDFRSDNVTCNVVLPRRSLCIMLDQSRYDWTHGITPRKSDVVLNSEGWLTVQNRQRRTSLTFRKTRKGDCTCKYPRLCDSFLRHSASDGISDLRNISLKKEASSELESNYVHKVYEKIASHFSETRQKPWPNVMKFVKSFDTGSILVDVGCGNGKYFTKQSERFEIGCDSSSGLLQLCKKQELECLSCNCLYIPIRDNVADGCICIAVIHHLTTDVGYHLKEANKFPQANQFYYPIQFQARRRQVIKEIIRILKSTGRALIYVWAKNQNKDCKTSSYLRQCTKKDRKETHDVPEVKVVSLDSLQEKLILPVHVNRTNFSHNDLLVPWKLKANDSHSKSDPVYLRYYHIYEEGELEDMCRGLEEVDILDSYYDEGNWCVILQKK